MVTSDARLIAEQHERAMRRLQAVNARKQQPPTSLQPVDPNAWKTSATPVRLGDLAELALFSTKPGSRDLWRVDTITAGECTVTQCVLPSGSSCCRSVRLSADTLVHLITD